MIFTSMHAICIKDAQAPMRQSHASTTMDIDQQFVPESQRAEVDKLDRLIQPVPRR